eukprot:6488219-Amphidinium_carterae.3
MFAVLSVHGLRESLGLSRVIVGPPVAGGQTSAELALQMGSEAEAFRGGQRWQLRSQTMRKLSGSVGYCCLLRCYDSKSATMANGVRNPFPG